MKHILIIVIALLFSLGTSAKTIYVVSVGICNYKYIKPLKKTENDAKAMASVYRTHTQQVTTLLGSQATLSNILATMRRVFAQAAEDDIVVFFFSGHGGKGGLCAYDTNSEATMISYKQIQNVLRECRSKNKQLFIDACFSGGLRSTANKATDSHPMSNVEGVMLFLSSRNGETSQDGIYASNGVFTQFLLKGMKGGADANSDRIVTARELFNFVSAKVSAKTNKKQNPVMWGRFNDDMHIMNWNAAK